MRYLVLALLLVSQLSLGLGKAPAAEQPTVDDFLGIWEAFQEGDPPNRAQREEPSKLVIFLDASNRITVILGVRYADRQIRFHYGIAQLSNGELRFVDQNGLTNRVGFGVDLKQGRFLSVAPDFRGAESEYGAYLKIVIK